MPALVSIGAFALLIGTAPLASAQESAEEAPVDGTPWVFFVLDFTFEDEALRAPRLPFYGSEVPNVSYPPGEEPRGSSTVELSPFPPGQPAVELGLRPARETRGGTLGISLGLTRSRRALYRWAANMESLVGPVDASILERDGARGLTRELPAEPVELLLLVGADDPAAHVAVRAYFNGRAEARRGEAEPASGWPALPRGVEPTRLTIGESVTFSVPYDEGQPGQQLVFIGDGLDVVAIF